MPTIHNQDFPVSVKELPSGAFHLSMPWSLRFFRKPTWYWSNPPLPKTYQDSEVLPDTTANIYIGDGTLLAPNVTIITAMHPISLKLRTEGYGYNKPVYIGKNVWIASNVTILPGVHIGDNSVIGAASVVTKDIPANVVAVGSPAKVIREITADDDIYYDHGKLIVDNII